MTIAGATLAGNGRILIFSKTAGWRHDSIPAGIAALQKIATDQGLHADATEDAAQFTADNLARYRAVVFLSTTGSVRGTRTGCILAISSGRSRVTSLKNFSPVIAALSETGEMP